MMSAVGSFRSVCLAGSRLAAYPIKTNLRGRDKLIRSCAAGTHKYSALTPDNQRKLSTSSSNAAVPSKIYELRIYRTSMSDFKNRLEMFEKFVSLRTHHSKLMGFWTAEIGASIHEVVHIWEYDNLNHRRTVRSNLAVDENWQKSFASKFIVGVKFMKNELLALAPGSAVDQDFEKDPLAVYTLQTVTRSVGELPPLPSVQNETLVARFLGVLGRTDVEHRLWRYTDIDAALERSWTKTKEDAGSKSNILLYPTLFSPLH